MKHDLINSIILALMFLSLFAIAELLYHQTRLKGDDTRKVVHIGTGLLSMLFPIMLQSHWFVLLLCTSFALILFLSLRFNLLQSINAIERVSYGSLLYPLAVYISFRVYSDHRSYIYFYLPVLIMALSDPIAAVFGKMWPYGKFYIMGDKKTAVGCMAFFLSSVTISIVQFSYFLNNQHVFGFVLLAVCIIAAASTLAEAVSVKGLDNLTIPLAVLISLTLLHV
jgi:phytol kinase